MMNILEIQDALKGLSNDQLVRELRTPSGSAPAFLVATEIDRRQKNATAIYQATAANDSYRRPNDANESRHRWNDAATNAHESGLWVCRKVHLNLCLQEEWRLAG